MLTCPDAMYASLPILHGLGALTAAGLSFGCDTGRAQQTARIPSYTLSGNPSHQHFLAAFPWDEGAEFATQTWNPFALIFVFEWLTAAFALRPLIAMMHPNRRTDVLSQGCLIWLVLGVAVFIAWSFANSGGICVAQFCLVLISFLATAAVCVWDGLIKRATNPPGFKLLPQGDKHADEHGRLWFIPNRIRGDASTALTPNYLSEDIEGVVWRYAEYCITAPLLFIAVACLMVSDAPAWLYLAGYWLLIVCNAIGIALHVSFILAKPQGANESGGVLPMLMGVLFAGPWYASPTLFFFCFFWQAGLMQIGLWQAQSLDPPVQSAHGGLDLPPVAARGAGIPHTGRPIRYGHASAGAHPDMEPPDYVQPLRGRVHHRLRHPHGQAQLALAARLPEPHRQVPAPHRDPDRLHHAPGHDALLLQLASHSKLAVIQPATACQLESQPAS